MTPLSVLPDASDLHRRPWLGVPLILGGYALALLPLLHLLRHGVVFNLLLVPCMVAVWRYGLGAGLATWAGGMLLHRLLIHGFMGPSWPGNATAAIVTGLLHLLVVIFASLWRRMLVELRVEIAHRRQVEADLCTHRDELHRLVEVRTQELEAAHQRLSHTEKLRSLGVLAGSLAHDFNNMLTTIHGFAELMVLKGGGEGAGEYARQVQQASLRARDLTRQLLTFSRENPPCSQPVSVHGLVHEVAGILRHTLGRSIALAVDLQARRCTVLGDGSQLQSALFNLALNARDAMPDGGQLLLSTRVLDEQGADWLALEVRDTGEGVPPEIQARIFEPFFTTKGLGKGTGLGLAAVWGIARRHGGRVSLESHPGHGAAFTLFLPLAEQELPAPRTGPRLPAALELPSTLRILAMTDSMLHLGLLQEMFRTLGCETRLARTWAEGRTQLEGVDLVLMDLDLADGTVESVLSALRQQGCRPPLALLHGGPACHRVEALLSQGVHLLEKPFETRDLAALMEACRLTGMEVAAGPVRPPVPVG